MSPASPDDHPAMRVTARQVKVIWIAYWLFLFVIMHIPVPEDLPFKVGRYDKEIHATAYGILTALGVWAWLRSGRVLTWSWLGLWLGIFAAYGAADELLQELVNRTAELSDWLADVVGVLLVLAITAALTRRR